jgi:hypothetical protein
MTNIAKTSSNASLGFELWDRESGNLIGVYDSEDEALVDVTETLAECGAEYAQHLSLLRVGPRGGLHRVALGEALAARARQAAHNAGVTERDVRTGT